MKCATCGHIKAAHDATFPATSNGPCAYVGCKCKLFVEEFDGKEPVASKDVRA